MGGSSGNSEVTEVRYAPYLEAAHEEILNSTGGDGLGGHSVFEAIHASIGQSPYSTYSSVDVDEGFFGYVEGTSTTYEISNFPSLFDMYGKFMAGLDVCDLWGTMYENVVQGGEITDAVTAHSEIVQDELDTTIVPRFLAGMRDINAVQSSAFVTGKALIANAHLKNINEFQAKIRLNAIQTSAIMWAKHLDWNREVMAVYSGMFGQYYSTSKEMVGTNLEYAIKDELWDLSVLDHGRAAIGAMAGAAAAKIEPEPSQARKALGGAMSGAAMGGAMTGGSPLGAVIGGLLGAAASFI